MNWQKIKSIRRIDEETTVFNFECIPNHVYFANNILTHNCRKCYQIYLGILDAGGNPKDYGFGEYSNFKNARLYFSLTQGLHGSGEFYTANHLIYKLRRKINDKKITKYAERNDWVEQYDSNGLFDVKPKFAKKVYSIFDDAGLKPSKSCPVDSINDYKKKFQME